MARQAQRPSCRMGPSSLRKCVRTFFVKVVFNPFVYSGTLSFLGKFRFLRMLFLPCLYQRMIRRISFRNSFSLSNPKGWQVGCRSAPKRLAIRPKVRLGGNPLKAGSQALHSWTRGKVRKFLASCITPSVECWKTFCHLGHGSMHALHNKATASLESCRSGTGKAYALPGPLRRGGLETSCSGTG